MMSDLLTPLRRAARPTDLSAARQVEVEGILSRARRRLQDERGISMMELVVTMALMSIVAAALSAVIVAASNAEVRTNRSFQAQVQGRIALNKVRRELHCASAIAVRSSSGGNVAAGTEGAQIAITLGGYCPTNGLTTNSAQSVYVTWCTMSSSAQTGRYALYRLASLSSQPSCATTGMKWADYLTTSTPFCLPSTTVACSGVYKSTTSLPTLHVGLPISLSKTSTTSTLFNITDDIAIRNGTRS